MLQFKYKVKIKNDLGSLLNGGVRLCNQIIVALCFNGADIVSGFLCAIKNKNISSSKLRDGLFKKLGFLMCYLIGFLIDNYGAIVNLHVTANVLPIIITYVCTTEVVSICENIAKINPDILPAKILEMLHLKE